MREVLALWLWWLTYYCSTLCRQILIVHFLINLIRISVWLPNTCKTSKADICRQSYEVEFKNDLEYSSPSQVKKRIQKVTANKFVGEFIKPSIQGTASTSYLRVTWRNNLDISASIIQHGFLHVKGLNLTEPLNPPYALFMNKFYIQFGKWKETKDHKPTTYIAQALDTYLILVFKGHNCIKWGEIIYNNNIYLIRYVFDCYSSFVAIIFYISYYCVGTK